MFFVISFTYGNNDKLVQFSGFITTKDTIHPVPYASVRITGTHRGAIANIEGFFSIVVKTGDTVEFSALGFKSEKIVIPSNIKNHSYSHIQPMKQDTITFPETVILPWQNFEEFKRSVLALDLPDDYLALARRNLEIAMLRQLNANMGMDGRESQLYQIQQHVHSFRYSGGQTNYHQVGGGGMPIPASLLSPQAWAELIDAIKTGKFKRNY